MPTPESDEPVRPDAVQRYGSPPAPATVPIHAPAPTGQPGGRPRNAKLVLAAVWGAVFLAAVVAIVLVTSGNDDKPGPGAATPPPASSSTPAAAPSAPEQATLTVPQNEEAYIAAVREQVPEEDLGDSDDLDIVNTGREACGMNDRLASGEVSEEYDSVDERYPPSLDSLIEDRPDKAAQLAIKQLCPKYLPVLKRAQRGFGEGPQEVGKDVKPGTYRTVNGMDKDSGTVQDCYWERSTKNGKAIANDFITNAPKGVVVTITSTDGGFTSRGCGNWVPAKAS